MDGYICSTVYSTPEWSYSVTHTQCTKYFGESVVQYCKSVQLLVLQYCTPVQQCTLCTSLYGTYLVL